MATPGACKNLAERDAFVRSARSIRANS